MAKITETELRRKLKKAGTGGGSSGPTASLVGDSWEYSEAVLYLAYASNITNESLSGVITNQSDAVGFQFSAFSSSGVLLPWRGYLFSKSIYASGDPTDYIWEDISAGSSASTMERYYSTYSGLLTEMGNPDYPGTMSGGGAVPWTSISTSSPIPDTAFFLAERYTINSVKSTWNVYAVATEENGFGLIPYTITGRNKPALNSSQWNADTILAVSAFTGRAYSSIREFGYGTTVVITYDDGKLYGMLKKVSGIATWVAPIDYIDGALLVDTTIIESKIADNAITVNKILNDAINSDKIANNAVTVNKILDGAINAGKIANNAVTVNKILNSSINADKIANNAVTVNKILDGAINSIKLADNAVTVNKILDNAINSDKIAANAVNTSEIAAGAVTANEIQANTIGANQLAANSITAGKLVVAGTGAIVPSTIGAGTIASVTAAQSDASTAITNAATAQGTADGKVTTFYQDEPPTAEGIGDLWSDTDDGNTLYRWSGTAWVNVQDSDMATAISNAATAQSTADGKIVSFIQTTAPTAEGVGDLWTDTDAANRLYRWSGTAWVDVQDTTVADNIYTATTTTIDGGKITTGSVAASKIVANSITAGEIAALTITASQIAANTISATQIAANTITAGEIAANTITAGQIQANTIGANEIAANSITAGQIAALTITTSELAAGSVTASEIVTGTITANEMAANSVTTSVLAANAVSADKIQANAVTASKINVTDLAAINANMGTITAGKMQSTDGKFVIDLTNKTISIEI